jgi:hypothetical protein
MAGRVLGRSSSTRATITPGCLPQLGDVSLQHYGSPRGCSLIPFGEHISTLHPGEPTSPLRDLGDAEVNSRAVNSSHHLGA